MDLLGKPTINPILFYTGKIAGFATWFIFFLLMIKGDIVERKSSDFTDYISFFLLLVGIVFMVLSMIHLGRSTRVGLSADKTIFKTKGLYQISRNPMYVGFHLITIASMIYTMNLWVIVLGLYSFLIYHLIIIGEERFLEQRFGKEYLNFKEKINRYL